MRTRLSLLCLAFLGMVASVQADSGQVRSHTVSPVAGSGAYGGAMPSQRTIGLPRGRAYYGNRYYGNFNNRFYGPQYGYF